ncbi:hypothetical protein ACQPX6_22635 [Actinomycetospora sp. CA-101289]|uniref:hypothetical protein n=1 Tax=Actinomycetospora sp. CA-101289 TaxID=3239893 RepID=UPI003D951671
MTTEPGAIVPDRGASVSIVDTAWGTVVRTQDALGIAAAVKLRRVVLRHPEAVVVLDLRATSVAEPVVVAAVADLAAGLRARESALRIVRSSHTPRALVAAADAPEYASLAEAFGHRPFGAPPVDPPTRPSGRRPPATGGRGGMGPGRPPLPPGAPVRTHSVPLRIPHARRPESD